MLVLQRLIGQRIKIGKDITITLVQVKGGGKHARVRIGIEAPPEVPVHREEIFAAIQADEQVVGKDGNLAS